MKMTKIELIQKRRKERLMGLTKDELIKKIMRATLFSDTYFLLKDADPMTPLNIEGTVQSMHKTLS
jgi:hypothetical protein